MNKECEAWQKTRPELVIKYGKMPTGIRTCNRDRWLGCLSRSSAGNLGKSSKVLWSWKTANTSKAWKYIQIVKKRKGGTLMSISLNIVYGEADDVKSILKTNSIFGNNMYDITSDEWTHHSQVLHPSGDG